MTYASSPTAQNHGLVAGSYSRFSSDMQSRTSIEDQQRRCREHAERNDHVIRPEFEFSDEAVSGTKLDRVGLTALMNAARGRQLQVLYFYDLGRLARESVISMPLLKELVHVHGVRCISVSEGIDSATQNWSTLATLLSLQHEQFIQALSQSVFRGQEGTVLAGFSVGDWNLGYRSEPIPGSESGRRGRGAKPRMRYVLDPEGVRWVKQIFHWFVEEERSIQWITRELTRQNAKKDHRSKLASWHHSYVKRILANTKYIGLWPWGKKANRRNPLNGKVHQELRTEEEQAKWIRSRPDLRIVEDNLFYAAQAKLKANKEKFAECRRPTGRLSGSVAGRPPGEPRHLLQGLIKCGTCGATFKVSGAHGNYLGCGNYQAGSCDCKTRLDRKLAEKVILRAIAERVLSEPAWVQMIFNELDVAWRRREENRPDALEDVERALKVVQQKIERLLNQIEDGVEDPEIKERLSQRRSEQQALLRQRDQLKAEAGATSFQAPTREWVLNRLSDLQGLLDQGGAAAARTLKALVGEIKVFQAEKPGRKRRFLRGHFSIRSQRLSQALLDRPIPELITDPSDQPSDEIVVEFTEPPPWERCADDIKAQFDAGTPYAQIAADLGCHRSWVSKALTWWHESRGLPSPDGRAFRKRMGTNRVEERLADAAKDLWDQGLLMQDIAKALQRNRDVITRAIQHWYTSRGLKAPDGRARRKVLGRQQADLSSPKLPQSA